MRVGFIFNGGWENLFCANFFSILLIGLSPICVFDDDVGPMWHLNMYLRHILTWSCIFII